MSVMVNLRKHYKRSDAERDSSFDPPAILFIPKATMLKTDNAQEFNLQVTPASKQSTYKLKACMFSKRTAEDILECQKWLTIVIKNKLISIAKSKFDLVEAILKGNVLMHRQEFKHIKIAWIPKNLDGTNSMAPGICIETCTKGYLCNHIKKPNKLLIKNTAARLRKINGMLARFPMPNNDPMAEDELCNILYRMVKHKWCEALHKSSRTVNNITIMELEEYFEQIELLDNIKQKGSDTIVVDDDSDDKKLSKKKQGKG
eukprot:399605-Ditylum_brightwellii.AAC.1